MIGTIVDVCVGAGGGVGDKGSIGDGTGWVTVDGDGTIGDGVGTIGVNVDGDG